MSDSSTGQNRRTFLQNAVALSAGLTAAGSTVSTSADDTKKSSTDKPMDIGSRRELFTDQALIGELKGGARQQLHHPVPREVALTHDEPWEGTGCSYHSIFQDGDIYRMYYKAWDLDFSKGYLNTGNHPLFCCYAESDDGVQWRKPDLGLHEFKGSTQNNITMTSGKLGPLNVDAGHPAIFKDENPNASADAKYKAIFRSEKPNGLLPFKSPDGLNWTPMTDAPILHNMGAFDSQNLAFWDATIGKYRAYWRIFTAGVTNDKEWKPAGIRAIRTAVSDDLVHWEPHTDLTYEDSPPQELYTNQIKPYHRAPHILIGLPTRYTERGWSESMEALPALKERKLRSASSERYGTAITDALLMTSRNGTHFTRWNEAFLRPGIERPDAWHYGHQYIGWQMIETPSGLPGGPNELSLYSAEGYWHGTGSITRRYSLRLDGFVSVNSPAGSSNELITKPVTFDGTSLHLNFATSAAGSIRVEIQQLNGEPIQGYALSDCHELFGDTVDRVVSWKNGPNVGNLKGKPVQLRFELNDADLYSLQFTV